MYQLKLSQQSTLIAVGQGFKTGISAAASPQEALRRLSGVSVGAFLEELLCRSLIVGASLYKPLCRTHSVGARHVEVSN